MNFVEGMALEAIASLVWPLCRVSGFFLSAFIFAGSAVPTNIRALLSLAFTFAVLPSIPQVNTSVEVFSIIGFMTTINQVIIGIALGFLTQFTVQSFVLAGQIVAMQTGLGFASLVDPVSGTNTPVIGQFFTILVTLVFFAVDGHLLIFRLLLLSFEIMPIGTTLFTEVQLREILLMGTSMFQVALTMAMSAICTMLVVNFTFGVMTKAAPQLNVFTLGFAVSMIIGFFVLVQSLGAFMGNFYNSLNILTETTCRLIGTSCQGFF